MPCQLLTYSATSIRSFVSRVVFSKQIINSNIIYDYFSQQHAWGEVFDISFDILLHNYTNRSQT